MDSNNNNLYRPNISYPETMNVLEREGGYGDFYEIIQVELNELIFR